MPVVYRPRELADRLGCSLRHIYDLRLPPYRLSERVTVYRADDAQAPGDRYVTVKGWPTIRRAATLLHCSPRQVRRLIQAGRIGVHRKPDGRILTDPESLLRLVGGEA